MWHIISLLQYLQYAYDVTVATVERLDIEWGQVSLSQKS